MSYNPITGTGSGVAPVVNIPWPFLDPSHVQATVNGAPVAFSWTGASQITFSAAAANGAAWEVSRATPADAPLVSFTDGAVVTGEELNLAQNQALYRLQELQQPTINGTPLAASSGSGLIGWISSAVGAVVRNVQDKLRDVNSVRDFGAAVDSTTLDDTAVTAAAADGPVLIPRRWGSLKTSVIPALFKVFSFGGSFSGAAALDSPYPAFGSGIFRTIMKGSENAIIAIVDNVAAAATVAFPAALTGFGINRNLGNTVFGGFFRGDQAANTGTTVGAEINAFNVSGADPSVSWPMDRSIGTAQQAPIANIAAAGGNRNSHSAYVIAREGSAPRSFLNGLVGESNALVNYFLVLNTSGTSLLPFWVKPDGTMLATNLTVPEATAGSVVAPAVGYQTLFIDSADHKLKRKDSSGTVTIIA